MSTGLKIKKLTLIIIRASAATIYLSCRYIIFHCLIFHCRGTSRWTRKSTETSTWNKNLYWWVRSMLFWLYAPHGVYWICFLHFMLQNVGLSYQNNDETWKPSRKQLCSCSNLVNFHVITSCLQFSHCAK